MIHEMYLPYSRDELKQHFTADAESNIDYFTKSAARYKNFLKHHQTTTGISISKARSPRQIEKDERFWTAATLKHIFDHPQRNEQFALLLSNCFGSVPPLNDFDTWSDCLDGELSLYFEAQHSSPKSYVSWLSENISTRHLIPYVFDAADRTSTRPLEGPTHVDAILINATNGFGVLIEAKVLSDSSCDVSFDCMRNQLTRNIDIMLQAYTDLRSNLNKRIPDCSLFCILTPQIFRDNPQARHYAHLLSEYKQGVDALVRDLSHRERSELLTVPDRIGWLTFEDVNSVFPGACPWLNAA